MPLQSAPAACNSRFQGRRPRGARRRLRDDGGDGSSRAISQTGRRSEFVRTQPSWYSQGAARSAILFGHGNPHGDADHLAKTWFSEFGGSQLRRMREIRPTSVENQSTGDSFRARRSDSSRPHWEKMKVVAGCLCVPARSWSFVFARCHSEESEEGQIYKFLFPPSAYEPLVEVRCQHSGVME